MKKKLFIVFYLLFSVIILKYVKVITLFPPLLFCLLKRKKQVRFWILGLIMVLLLEGMSLLHFGVFLSLLLVQYFLFKFLSIYINHDEILCSIFYFMILSLGVKIIITSLANLESITILPINSMLFFVFNFILFIILEILFAKYDLI